MGGGREREIERRAKRKKGEGGKERDKRKDGK